MTDEKKDEKRQCLYADHQPNGKVFIGEAIQSALKTDIWRTTKEAKASK